MKSNGVPVFPLVGGVSLFCFELGRVFHFDLLVVEHNSRLLIFHNFREDVVIVNGLDVSTLLYLAEVVDCFL